MQAAPAASPARAFAPFLAIVGSLISVNVGAAYAKGLFPLVGPAGITAVRVGLASMFLMAFWRPWRAPLARADALNVAIYGVMLGMMNLLVYAAFARIPIGVVIAIEVIGPLAVVVLSSRHLRDFMWVGCAAFGLWLLAPTSAGAAALDPLGVAAAAGAGFCWAMYIVFGKRVSTLKGGHVVAWGMFTAALCTVPVGIASAGTALFTRPVLLGGLAVALLSSILPYSLEMMALSRLPRRVFGILVSAGPAVGALAGFLVLGEVLTVTQWLAIGMIVVATAGSAATAGKT